MVSKEKDVPKGKLVPMYLGDDGALYSFRYKDEAQLEEVSEMLIMFLGGIMGGKIVLDPEPLNDVFFESYRVKDKSKEDGLDVR